MSYLCTFDYTNRSLSRRPERNVYGCRHETLDNLAHEFGVSRYTIMRDIVQLQERYPIKAKCGYEGCYSLPDGYYISERHLTPKQANAVRECIVTADFELRPILESILDDFAW